MQRARKLLLILAIWVFTALFFAVQDVVSFQFLGRKAEFFRSLSIYLTCALTWFAFTPLIVRVSRRFRLGEGKSGRHVLAHVAASLLFSVVSMSVFIVITPHLVELKPRPFLDRLHQMLLFDIHLDLLRYWAVVAVEHALRLARQARERELAESQLRAELAEARLEVLKRQLHPHFLFNTLNSISMLMFENVTLANRMLLRLSELLRAGLTTDSPHEVSLERELAFLERYLDIERIRFGDRLTIDVDVDPATLGARVPNLLLQPLVENAIRYGVGSVDRASRINISAEKSGDELRLQVRDDGPGLPRNARRGVGLSNTEARLRQLYGNGQRLELITPSDGGLLVSIAIPYSAA
ncbi:MAG TPA: histidine kinase [Thermoanaerobaculia bacterium]|nr:histidine kinase [Thermoanaerobaculia bacterium]